MPVADAGRGARVDALSARPLHIDLPGATPVPFEELPTAGGLERPLDDLSPVWARVAIRTANGMEHVGAVRILPGQRNPGDPPYARLTAILIERDGRLSDPMSSRERAAEGFAAMHILPLMVRFDADPPHGLSIRNDRRGDIAAGEWSRSLKAVDLVEDIAALRPL